MAQRILAVRHKTAQPEFIAHDPRDGAEMVVPLGATHRHFMPELTPQQMKIFERLFAAGFRPVAIPPYESALCVRRGDCAALLSPVQNGGLSLLAAPTYIVDGNLSVKLKRGDGEVFVWKKKEIAASADRLNELDTFRRDLTAILEEAVPQ